MRLLKTHFYVSERIGYGVDKDRVVTTERKGPIRNGEKTSMETTAMSSEWGGERGENMSTEKPKPEVSPLP